MRPLNDIVVIEPITKEITLASGMITSSSDMDTMRYMYAKVIAVSEEIEKGLVSVGDEIMYDKNNSHQAYVDNNLVTMIRKRDIVVIL